MATNDAARKTGIANVKRLDIYSPRLHSRALRCRPTPEAESPVSTSLSRESHRQSGPQWVITGITHSLPRQLHMTTVAYDDRLYFGVMLPAYIRRIVVRGPAR